MTSQAEGTPEIFNFEKSRARLDLKFTTRDTVKEKIVSKPVQIYKAIQRCLTLSNHTESTWESRLYIPAV